MLQVVHGHREVEVGHVILSHIGHHKVGVGLDVILHGVGHLSFEVGILDVNLRSIDHADDVQESCKHTLHSPCRFLHCKYLSILLSLTSSFAFGSLESQV